MRSGSFRGLQWDPKLDIFNSDLKDIIECTVEVFGNDTKLERTVNMMEGRAASQGRQEEWTNRSLMNYKNKCQILHLKRRNLRHQ